MASTSFPRGIEYLCVLDFEAVCEKDVRIAPPQEILEFPTVLVHVPTQKIIAEFHFYVRPQVHTRISAFCTELTGIEQATVDAGITFEDCFARHIAFLRSHNLDPNDPEGAAPGNHSFAYATCGDWDLKTCLPQSFAHFRTNTLRCFQQWINVKKAFTELYPRLPPARGMDQMLTSLRMPLVGRHHSGIDDARNIAAIVLRMLADGYQPRLTFFAR